MTDGGKKSQTSLSSDSEQEVDISWRGVIEAPSAVDAQQALLNFAGVAAATLSTGHGSEECSGNVTLGEEIDVRTSWFDQEADLRRVENGCLILSDIVQNNRAQRIKRRAFDHQISTQTLPGKELQTGQAVSELHGQLNVCEQLELLLQEQNLETETKVREGNKQLITNVNNWSINEPQACPLLRNNALDCGRHRNQTFLLDKCKRSFSKPKFTDLETTLLKVVNKAAQSRIRELVTKLSKMSKAAVVSEKHTSTKLDQLAHADSKMAELKCSHATCISQGSSRFAHLYKTKTGLSPDQWKNLVKKAEAHLPRFC